MLRYLDAGESHGKALCVIVDGVPSGLPLSAPAIQEFLQARKQGYGRGGRQKIESDHVEILSGVRFGKTIGSPISLLLRNEDYANWQSIMDPEASAPGDYQPITTPRPGHADYAGYVKYQTGDIRDVLERSSARETAMRVAVGAIATLFLGQLGIQTISYVLSIGSALIREEHYDTATIANLISKSDCRTIETEAENQMKNEIDEAARAGTSLGGRIMVVVAGVPIGLGSHTQWDRKLDANIARAVMSVQAIKAVEFGLGAKSADLPGDQVHDSFGVAQGTIVRASNHAGGIEGGMSNGQPIIVKAAMKPIPTMKNPLQSVDLTTKQAVPSFFERADVCAVPAAAVVCEGVVAIEIANALLEKFGGDSLSEIQSRIQY